MALPPLHRADGTIEYIHPKDLAWDNDKFDADLNGQYKDRDDHPALLYITGQTRYELTPAVREYFLDGVRPTIWHLDRLPRSSWQEVRDMRRRGSESRALEYALIRSLKEIDDGGEPFPLKGPTSPMKSLSKSDMDRLEARFGRVFLEEIGEAVVLASGDLTAIEKKQSD